VTGGAVTAGSGEDADVDTPAADARWEAMAVELEAYRAKWGHASPPLGNALGRWVGQDNACHVSQSYNSP
jgi:hypothetical protein